MRDLIVSETGFAFRAAVVLAAAAAALALPDFVAVIGGGFTVAAAMVASAFRTPEPGAR